MNQPQSLSELVELAAQYRDASGLGLSQLAAKNGYQLTATTINQIRQGLYKSKPREATLRALAWLAGVSDEVAFTAAGQTVPGPPFAEELPPGVDNLSPKARKVVLDMVRVLVDLEKSANASNADALEEPTDIRTAGKRRDSRIGQKTEPVAMSGSSDDGNIPLPDNWRELAAYSGPQGHLNRQQDWLDRGEESQEASDDH